MNYEREQKYCVVATVKEEKVDNANKIESKFHEGDYITNGNHIWKVIKVQELYYILQSQSGTTVDDDIFSVDKYFHLWTIKDAKDGDMLIDKYNNIGIFEECEGMCWHSYIYLGCDGELRGFSIGGSHEQTNTHPATKEQCDLLFQKMKEEGYEWDAGKKELKKIEKKPQLKILSRTPFY